MDDEDLASLLRNQSSSISALPGFYASNTESQQDDPFANPFANPFATDEPTFRHAPVFEPTKDASDSPYSRHLEENVIESYDSVQPAHNEEAPWGVQPAADLYEDAPLAAMINRHPPTSFEDTLYSSAHVRPAEQPAVPSDYQFEASYRTNDPRSLASSSTTRIQPDPDILGLLPSQDPTEDLKKAFKPTEPAKKDSVGPLSDSSRTPVTASPYVFRTGGSSSKKKGITFDSVQRERERKKEQTLREEEARKTKEEEVRKAEETKKLSARAEEPKTAAESTEPVVSPDAPLLTVEEENVDFSKLCETEQVDHDSVLERAATAAETLSHPGPAIPTAIAEQILNSEHPDQAAQHVAQLIAAHDQNGSMDTATISDRDPALVPLPASRSDTPVQQDTTTTAKVVKLDNSALPLNENESAQEPLFSALSIGASSDTSNGNVENTYGPIAGTGRNSRWGRAFEEQGDVEDTSQTSQIQHGGWTTDVGNLSSVTGPLSYGNQHDVVSWGGDEPSLVVDTAGDQYVEQAGIPQSPEQSVTRSPTEVRSPTRNRLLTQPVFSISVSDPTKVGDPVRGYIVYTVTTRTTSPHYRRGEFSVLRRFSDFLWLAEAISNNNPGVIVPPLPDKHAFGRFEEQFVETRRAALERTVGKMANHPVLSLDPDLKLFLSSEAFSIDVKHRRQEMTQEKQGVLSSIGSIGGPRYTEQDSWFDIQKTFLDNLEAQIKALTKCLESTSRQRLELANSFASIAEALQQLAESDLSMALSQVLHQFSVLSNHEREMQEGQAKLEVTRLLNLADEHVRLIGSVRSAFIARIKTYFNWQNAEAEARRIKVQVERERTKKGGKYAPDRSSMIDSEITQAERRVIDAQSDFEAVSRLIKLEYSRFEQERVEDFKSALERYVQGACESQRELVAAWEKFHSELGELVGQADSARL